MADAATKSKLGSSALSNSTFEARPRAQSWRKMYESLTWTASTIYGERGSGGRFAVGMNKTCLLPCLDLGVRVNVWNVVICPSLRMNSSGLGYQKRARVGRTLGIIVDSNLSVNVVLGSPRAGERGKDNAM